MIPFLRKIRKRLITNHKVGGYLLYAIGEIALIIVGILLALQINNWNEGRKDSKIEHQYLLRLKEDLEKDASVFLFIEELTSLRLEQVDLIYSVLDEPALAAQNPKAFLNAIEQVSWRSYLPQTRVVYNELLSTGRMSLIKSEELRTYLADYYRTVDHWWEMILGQSGNQDDYSRATAGLLSKDILAAIENAASLENTTPDESIDIEISPVEIREIRENFLRNEDALRFLPNLYHYHILGGKVIQKLEEQNSTLLEIVGEEIDQ